MVERIYGRKLDDLIRRYLIGERLSGDEMKVLRISTSAKRLASILRLRNKNGVSA